MAPSLAKFNTTINELGSKRNQLKFSKDMCSIKNLTGKLKQILSKNENIIYSYDLCFAYFDIKVSRKKRM